MSIIMIGVLSSLLDTGIFVLLLRRNSGTVLYGSLTGDSALNFCKSASDFFGTGRGLLPSEDGNLALLLWVLDGNGGGSKLAASLGANYSEHSSASRMIRCPSSCLPGEEGRLGSSGGISPSWAEERVLRASAPSWTTWTACPF